MKINKIWFLGLGIIALLLIVIFTQGFGFFNFTQSVNNEGIITIPLSEISENAKWYEYNNVRFFAVKDNDGVLRTALDACDVCYAFGKGYKQEGDYMICNNCGNRYPISGLGTENKSPGGCWPSYLPNIIAGDNIIIQKSDL